LGNAYFAQGRFAEALKAYLRVEEINGNCTAARSNYLFCLNFDPSQSDQQLFTAHQEWGRRHGRDPTADATYRNRPEVGKVLRIGLVSADFGRHPVGYFLDPLLSCSQSSSWAAGEVSSMCRRSTADGETPGGRRGVETAVEQALMHGLATA
jgi:hypothetical protein